MAHGTDKIDLQPFCCVFGCLARHAALMGLAKTVMIPIMHSACVWHRSSLLLNHRLSCRFPDANATLQGVFSACQDVTRVVTVIDKDTDHPCPPC